MLLLKVWMMLMKVWMMLMKVYVDNEGVDVVNVNEGVDDPEIDAIIEEMLAFFYYQTFQEQLSQICNLTLVYVSPMVK